METIIIGINNIETIEEDQNILLDMGFKWVNKPYNSRILNKYRFNIASVILIKDNIMYILNKNFIDDIKEYKYYDDIVSFSRIYKLNKILKKDI